MKLDIVVFFSKKKETYVVVLLLVGGRVGGVVVGRFGFGLGGSLAAQCRAVLTSVARVVLEAVELGPVQIAAVLRLLLLHLEPFGPVVAAAGRAGAHQSAAHHHCTEANQNKEKRRKMTLKETNDWKCP